MRGIILRSVGVLAALLMAIAAQAAVIITATQTSGDVIFTTEAGGSLDLTGLIYVGEATANGSLKPDVSFLHIGDTTFSFVDLYEGYTASPASLGSGTAWFYASGGIGDDFGMGSGYLAVPRFFNSGGSISGSSTYSGETLASMGIDPGTYVWEWSSDSVTLNVNTVPIPAAVWLFGSALGLLGWIRRMKS